MGLAFEFRRWIGLSSRRPAVVACLCLIGGIALHNIAPAWPAIWLAGAAAVTLSAVAFKRAPIVSSVLLMLAIGLIGLTVAQLDRFFFASTDICQFTTDGERLVQLQLVVDDPPKLITGSDASGRPMPPKQTLTAAAVAVLTTGGWESCSGNIDVTIAPPHPRLGPGQRLRVVGYLSRPLRPVNPGQFDWAAYCRDQRILTTLRLPHADSLTILDDPGPGPIVRLRQRIRELLAQGFTPDRSADLALLRAFFLGDPDPEIRDVQDQFARTGTIHNLAITGLHIVIIGGLTLLIMRMLRFQPARATLTAMAVVGLYALIALPSQAGFRSVALFGVAGFGWLRGRSFKGLQLLAVTVSVILLIHPMDLYSGGFQVSVAAVAALLLCTGPLDHFVFGLWYDNNPNLKPPRENDPGRIRAAAHWIGRFAWGTTVNGLVAWAAIIPLVAYHHQELSPWAVPGNLILLPVTFVAMIGAVLKVVFTALFPTAAGTWATIAIGPIIVLRHGVAWLASLPGADITMPRPQIWLIVGYYALLLMPLAPWRRTAARWAARLAPLAACLVLIAARPSSPAPVSPQVNGSGDRLELTLLSIGAGQCGVARLPGGTGTIFDLGSISSFDVYRSTVDPFLRHEGITHIDTMFLSHGDYDHISCAAEMIQTGDVRSVRISPHFRRHAIGDVPAEQLLDVLDETPALTSLTRRGDHIDLPGNAAVDVLWPPEDCPMNSNNCGLVLRLTYAGRSILLPADIQEPAESVLLLHPEQLKSDVLVAPHHGSAESTTAAFLKAVDPQFIICSNAERLTHKQHLFDQLAESWPVYRTSDDGAITVTIDHDGKLQVCTFLIKGPAVPVKVLR